MDQALKKAANFEGIKGDNQNTIEQQRQTSALPLVKVPRNPMRNTHDGRAHKQTFFNLLPGFVTFITTSLQSLLLFIVVEAGGLNTEMLQTPSIYMHAHVHYIHNFTHWHFDKINLYVAMRPSLGGQKTVFLIQFTAARGCVSPKLCD